MGLSFPSQFGGKPIEGEAISAESGARNEQRTLITLDGKVGDRVLLGTEMKLDREKILITKESDLLGLVEGARSLAKVA